MSDKADVTQMDQIANSLRAANNGAVADFVANLLPKESPKGEQSNSGTLGAAAAAAAAEAVHQGQKIKNSDGSHPIDQIEPWESRLLERTQIVGAHEQGVIELKTGDKLVRVKGTEVLVMPDGGALIVKADGSYELSKTKANVKHDAKTGTTTLEMGQDSITIKDGKIIEVTRGGRTAVMMAEKFNLWDKTVPNFEPRTPIENNKFPRRGGGGGGGGGDNAPQPNSERTPMETVPNRLPNVLPNFEMPRQGSSPSQSESEMKKKFK